jgi:hypothetical protein
MTIKTFQAESFNIIQELFLKVVFNAVKIIIFIKIFNKLKQ